MRFLTDRCVGRRLAEWLRTKGHDVVEAETLRPDPGDRALLERAGSEDRVLVTVDKDFGELIYLRRVVHAGLILLPDARVAQRIELVEAVIDHHHQALKERAVIQYAVGGFEFHTRRPQDEALTIQRRLPFAIVQSPPANVLSEHLPDV